MLALLTCTQHPHPHILPSLSHPLPHSHTRTVTLTPQIDRILQQLNIHYVHFKIRNYQLIIGFKNEDLQRRYEAQIPMNLFDRNRYYSVSQTM